MSSALKMCVSNEDVDNLYIYHSSYTVGFSRNKWPLARSILQMKSQWCDFIKKCMNANMWLYFIGTGLELQGLQECRGGRMLYLVKMVCWVYDIDVVLFSCIGICCLLVLKIFAEVQKYLVKTQQVSTTSWSEGYGIIRPQVILLGDQREDFSRLGFLKREWFEFKC